MKTQKKSSKPQPTTRAERAVIRRRRQARLAQRRYRERHREALRLQEEERRRGKEAPTWRLPPEPEQPFEPTVTEAEEQPKSSPEPAPAPRRAVRAEPTRRTHGPNRGGESARSWGERNPTGPVGPGFLDEGV